MRSPALLSLLILCGWPIQVEARLFWQTYGSTVPVADGCTWNANSDYFVPRHCDTGRYGLFSPCKHSCTTSPACRRSHAVYPGYCSPYGCFHYCWRNRVYGHKCGCSPIPYHGPYRAGCGPYTQSCQPGMCPADGACESSLASADCIFLPNVESEGFQILGAISLSGDPLLTSLQLGGGLPITPGQLPPPAPLPTHPSQLPMLEHSPANQFHDGTSPAGGQ